MAGPPDSTTGDFHGVLRALTYDTLRQLKSMYCMHSDRVCVLWNLFLILEVYVLTGILFKQIQQILYYSVP